MLRCVGGKFLRCVRMGGSKSPFPARVSLLAGRGRRGAGSRTGGTVAASTAQAGPVSCPVPPQAVIWKLGRAFPSRSGASPAASQPWGDAEAWPAGITGVPAPGAHYVASPGPVPRRGMAWRSSPSPKTPLPGTAACARAAPSSHASSEGVRPGSCILQGRGPCPALPGGARLELKHHPSLRRQRVIPGRSVQLLREIPWELN